MSDIDSEAFIAAAERHGEDEDPDHEAGDLQDCFRAAHALFDADQLRVFGSDPEIAATLAMATTGAAAGLRDEVRDLRNIFRVAFGLLSPGQRIAFLSDKAVMNVMEVGSLGVHDDMPEEDLEDPLKLYAAMVRSNEGGGP